MGISIETIKKRISVRTYNDTSIGADTLDHIRSYLEDSNHLSGPFGYKALLKLLPVQDIPNGQSIKLGTYGIIRNPKAYIAGTVEREDDATVDFGYVFEKLILFLTDLGLGTCWLGGTFDKSAMNTLMQVEAGKVLPAITPIGYGAGKRRVFESAMRSFVHAGDRKPWRELFFKKDFNTPLAENTADLLNTPLEMVRIGPSASNKQPWRIVISDSACHFYVAHTPGYVGNKMGYDMQRLDIGIAMSHFELACKELSIPGHWVKSDPHLSEKEEPVYIISWQFA